MKKTSVPARIFAVLVAILLLIAVPGGCGGRDGADATGSHVDETVTLEDTDGRLTDEQALDAVRNYCFGKNPELESMVESGEYPIYWDIASSGEQEVVVLFRSYTSAQERFYIDRSSGETYVTEFVPGITENEERTDESFNVRDHLSGDSDQPGI